MIILFENGRTGNQLFQYIGLKKYFPRDKLVFIGFKELFQFFDKIDVYFLNKNKLACGVEQISFFFDSQIYSMSSAG